MWIGLVWWLNKIANLSINANRLRAWGMGNRNHDLPLFGFYTNMEFFAYLGLVIWCIVVLYTIVPKTLRTYYRD